MFTDTHITFQAHFSLRLHAQAASLFPIHVPKVNPFDSPYVSAGLLIHGHPSCGVGGWMDALKSSKSKG
jgi:hypothetical protein